MDNGVAVDADDNTAVGFEPQQPQAAATAIAVDNVVDEPRQFFGLRRRLQGHRVHVLNQQQERQQPLQHQDIHQRLINDDDGMTFNFDDHVSNDHRDDVNDDNLNNDQPLPPQLPNDSPEARGDGLSLPQQQRTTPTTTSPDVESSQTSPRYFLASFLIVVVAIVLVAPPPNVHQLLVHSMDPQFVEYAKQKDGPFNSRNFITFKEEEVDRSKKKNNKRKNNNNNNNNNKVTTEIYKSVVENPSENNSTYGMLSNQVKSWLQPVFDHVWSFGYLSPSSSSLDRHPRHHQDPFFAKKKSEGSDHHSNKHSKDQLHSQQHPLGQYQSNVPAESLYSHSIDLWKAYVIDPMLSFWKADYVISGSDSLSAHKSTAKDEDSSSLTSVQERIKAKTKEDRTRKELSNGRRSVQEVSTGQPGGLNSICFQSVTCQHLYYVVEQFIDPAILHPGPESTTDIIDKVLTSTPRLLAIANFMLALTYLLHSFVAAWFLGPQPQPRRQNNQLQQQGASEFTDWTSINGGPNSDSSARERMGGFLVFKLLLISAVVSPDTFDLLILLTWYTTMSCLRSLDHLAHSTTMHLLALGQPPRKGVVQLLFWILVCDSLAALSCVALFHDAGWGMVILLISDCALLACEIVQHILKYFATVFETVHSDAIQEIETRQLELHSRNQTSHDQDNYLEDNSDDWEILDGAENNRPSSDTPADVTHTTGTYQTYGGQRRASQAPLDVQEESRLLDYQMEQMELSHGQKIAILNSVMYAFDLIGTLFQVFHFGHIWTMHGIQLTLIDGVLALHLQSSISSLFKKVAQRRNMNSISRDLAGLFPDASEEELRKASVAGDVCSICLGTMTTGGHVKKLKCSHLFHTHCLREVVERAQSIHGAKCPLCRSSMIDGTRHDGSTADHDAIGGVEQQGDPAIMGRGNDDAARDRALFRFSTEHLLPAWLPVPAFSFEVVRRSPLRAGALETPPTQPEQADGHSPAQQSNEQRQEEDAAPPGNETDRNIEILEANANDQPSFIRRFLVMAGVVPMSAEEESRTIEQLVDMFPQYDRSDLLRELRQRGSAEAVAESILLGVFSGVPRNHS